MGWKKCSGIRISYLVIHDKRDGFSPPVIIHEISQLRLDTEDKAYIGVMSFEGRQDLTKMIDLLDPAKLPLNKGEREESDRQRRARGSEDALKNADSFTTATRYLAYAT